MFDFLKKKNRILINYNSEDLNEGEKLQAVFNENAYLKGKIARINAEIANKKEIGKEEDKEQDKIKVLVQEMDRLREKESNPILLSKIFNYTNKSRKNPQKYPPIHFTTFDCSKVLGTVDDFCVTADGSFGAISNGEVIWASKNLNNVFYWVAGLNNLAKNRVIPLSVNSKGQFQPNIQTEEVSELVKMSDGKFKVNKFNKKPLYEEMANLHD